jgi:hypothetical protein
MIRGLFWIWLAGIPPAFLLAARYWVWERMNVWGIDLPWDSNDTLGCIAVSKLCAIGWFISLPILGVMRLTRGRKMLSRGMGGPLDALFTRWSQR